MQLCYWYCWECTVGTKSCQSCYLSRLTSSALRYGVTCQKNWVSRYMSVGSSNIASENGPSNGELLSSSSPSSSSSTFSSSSSHHHLLLLFRHTDRIPWSFRIINYWCFRIWILKPRSFRNVGNYLPVDPAGHLKETWISVERSWRFLEKSSNFLPFMGL